MQFSMENTMMYRQMKANNRKREAGTSMETILKISQVSLFVRLGELQG